MARSELAIDGTEVVHRTCALRGGLTRVGRMRQEQAVATSNFAAERARLQALTSATETVRSRLWDDNVRLTRKLAAHDDAIAIKDLAVRRAAMERDAAIAERDAARRELAVVKSIPVVVQDTSTAQPTQPNDDGAARFALLELD